MEGAGLGTVRNAWALTWGNAATTRITAKTAKSQCSLLLIFMPIAYVFKAASRMAKACILPTSTVKCSW